ncbi:MAG: carboxypeptidase regulatory-like domain-containing protein [Clostridiales Family XIII bacterium]|jgi:Fe-S-cluster-containing dehydrogenase component|nr:carboxypeptidase regulatory-like domain-containing protein [Clostridiales Family XIII bacterium]
MGKVFIIDVAKCTGCHNCQLACKDEHCGNDWTPYAKPQPETGQFWCKVEEHVRGTVPKVRIHYTAKLCNHCENAPCISASKNGAVYRRDDGLVIIDPVKSAGQRQLVSACPYGAVYFNEALGLPQKCTGCAHLLDHGAKLPRCVDACPTDAMVFGEADELRDLAEGAECLLPETGARPRVHYRNIPGMFIGGTVYDPDKEEIIEGAFCRLQSGGRTRTTVTDEFGDFWFTDLPVGVFDLAVDAKGYRTRVFTALKTDKSLNLGDIAMRA